MSEKIDIILLDKSNNVIQEKNILKPSSFQDLITKINSSFINLPQYYNIFNIGENNKEIIINNNEAYKSMNNIVFIREVNKNNLELINVILIDNSNNVVKEINIVKPKTYNDFLNQIKSSFTNLPKNYNIFNLGEKNKEIIINNNETYKSMKGIIFIREVNNNNLNQSLFELNYNRLSESKQNNLDDKYSCFICAIIIKNEKPLFCYKCQKIFHNECLKEWDNKRKAQNQNLSCPNCRKELPFEEWNKKLDYEENRNHEAYFMEKINKYQLNNNLQKIKEEKLKNVKANNIINKNEFVNEKMDLNEEKQLSKVFKNILKKIKIIQILTHIKIDDNLDKIIHKNESNKLEIYNTANVIYEQIKKIEKNIRNNYKVSKLNNILQEFRNNKINKKNVKPGFKGINVLENKKFIENTELIKKNNWGFFISNWLINKEFNSHIYNDVLINASIIGITGELWACYKNLTLTKDEVDKLTILFKQNKGNKIPSVYLAGQKYQVIHYIPEFSLYLKIKDGGATIAKTNRAYIIGIYCKNISFFKDKRKLSQCSGMCNVVVEDLAIMLKSMDY